MDENDPRLIVTLEPVNPIAERAWNRPHNRDRCVPGTEPDGEVVDIPSRETTPDAPEQRGSQIQLTFDNKPKNLEKGFVFGSDPEKCDVLLGGWDAGFSRQHFRITFNARGEVILEDTSRVVTSVDYNGEKPKGRNHFTWILFDRYENIEVTLNKSEDQNKKNTNELIFKVERPKNRKYCRAEYEAHRDAYLEERRTALPPLSQLGVESQQTTALLTAPHSPRQQPIYLPEEELGRGSFGTVYKAVDVSTGYVYAAKKFHGGNWKKEVKILKSISHEYIVEFVDFSEEQKPLLVMEYLPLGNLACQDLITEEETLQILCQGLQALQYLHSHSPPLAHRDIKPENILVRSRIPFVIKLVDFGLAKDDSALKTFCGTNEYAAPEIWERHRYTALVDIWSLGVVVLQYGYGLPRPSQRRKGKPWCRDVVKAAEDMEGEGDSLIDLISTKMLRMDYRHRQSASCCLGEVYRLGFHTVEIGRTTPTGKMIGQDGVRRTTSVVTQPLQNAPSDSDVSSGFYDIVSASETTEVNPSKRRLREGVHIYNLASPRSLGRDPQGPTQIRDPQTEDGPTSTLNKRRRLQTIQSRTPDALGRGHSKRARALVSYEAGEQLYKASNPRQGPGQLERRISSNHQGLLATDVASLNQNLKPFPQVVPEPTRRRTRSPLGKSSAPTAEGALPAGNLDGESEGKARVTDFDTRHVQIKLENQIVLMRKEDCFLNATQILTLAEKTTGERTYILRLMKEETKVEVLPAMRGCSHPTSWVNFYHGRILCKHLGLEEKLKSLIDYGIRLQGDGFRGWACDYLTEKTCKFFPINALSEPVFIRKADSRINATQVLRAIGREDEMTQIKREYKGAFSKVTANAAEGIYVDFRVGVELCQTYGLTELEQELLTWKGVPQELAKEPELSEPVREPELSEFVEITGFSSPVLVRTSDFEINASHLARLTGHSRMTVASLRNRLIPEAYEILRGNKKHQGTYVNFDVGIGLCREYGAATLSLEAYFGRAGVRSRARSSRTPAPGIGHSLGVE